MLIIDAKATFAAALLMSASQKMRFGTSEPDIAADGQRKFAAEIAVTYRQEPGRLGKAVSEVITVSVLGTDPSEGIPAGSPVEFDQLRCGFSTPERREGSNRISGGKPFFMASAIRPAVGQRAVKADQAA